MVSKSGARDIILSQIKQDFVTPANAIFDYLDIVEKALSKLDVPSDDELDQIKSSIYIQTKTHQSHKNRQRNILN
jgi:hypothetical protein